MTGSLSRTLRREAQCERVLPYSAHLTPSVVRLDTGALMTMVRLDGVSFETADVSELNALHHQLNGLWRSLADDRLAIWHHLVRRTVEAPASGDFISGFAAELDKRVRALWAGQKLLTNELYLTLLLRPTRSRPRPLKGLRAKPAPSQLDEADLKRLTDAARDLVAGLGRYNPRLLGLKEERGLWFSEPAAVLRLLLSGAHESAPLVTGHLGASIHAARLIFGRELIEIRQSGQTRFAGMLGLKEYPPLTRPGHWNALLSAPFPFVFSQSFAFLSKAAAQAVLGRKQNQMLSVGDRAYSQIAGLSEAMDDLASNRFVMGDHQASLLVLGDAAGEIGEHLSYARGVLADSGLVAAREDIGLEAAFWAQFPGNARYRTRPAAISSRNFSGLAPFHAHPCGQASGNHWGASVALFKTAAGSPYHFNFHQGDLGHAFICGPSGSGKTVLQGLLLARLETLGAQRVVIDKDRGAELFVRACAGRYLSLKRGEPTGLAPLKLPFTAARQAHLTDLVAALVGGGQIISALERRRIEEALRALAPLPAQQRSFGALRALLGQGDPQGLGARLARWCAEGPLGWALDNERDQLDLDQPLIGLDMTELLDHPEVRNPVLMDLFHRFHGLLDGRRLVIDIDECWKALEDEAFRRLAQDGLKTFRKQNALIVLGTQSPADVLRSPIAPAVLEQCATKIFLPNPQASFQDYVEGFGLSQREWMLVREELSPRSGRFLVKQGQNSVVAELDLRELADELAILSGRTETVALLEQLRAQHGEDPACWLPHFHQLRRAA